MLENKGQINHNIPVPLYYQLKELILEEIKSGNYKSGDAIPTEQELTEMFELSRTTVRQATSELVRDGWLYKVKSKGTFVGRPRISQDFINRVESYDKSIEAMNMVPSTEVIELKTMDWNKVPEDARKALKLSEGAKVIYLFRKRLADNEPVVIVRTYLPYASCSGVLDHDFFREKLYDVLGENDQTRIYKIEREMEAVEATAEDARLLDMKKGKPIHAFVSTGFNVYGDPIEYSLARYRGDRSRFQVTVFTENSDR